jgi:hypothetical protein
MFGDEDLPQKINNVVLHAPWSNQYKYVNPVLKGVGV